MMTFDCPRQELTEEDRAKALHKARVKVQNCGTMFEVPLWAKAVLAMNDEIEALRSVASVGSNPGASLLPSRLGSFVNRQEMALAIYHAIRSNALESLAKAKEPSTVSELKEPVLPDGSTLTTDKGTQESPMARELRMAFHNSLPGEYLGKQIPFPAEHLVDVVLRAYKATLTV